jgi:hypothetical protein
MGEQGSRSFSEVVGVSPLPEMNMAHWPYSPLSLSVVADFRQLVGGRHGGLGAKRIDDC